MSRGTKLELDEQGKIIALDNADLSQAAISKKLGKSKRVIENFLKSPKEYGRNARPGINLKLHYIKPSGRAQLDRLKKEF